MAGRDGCDGRSAERPKGREAIEAKREASESQVTMSTPPSSSSHADQQQLEKAAREGHDLQKLDARRRALESEAAAIVDEPMGIDTPLVDADGYPRAMPDGAPVSVAGVICPLAGRVSMDRMTVDVTLAGDAVKRGAPVELWGREVPIETLASLANTIPYELFCNVAPRVARIWS